MPDLIPTLIQPMFNLKSYPARILSLGPMAYWPLNDPSGSTALNLANAALSGTYTGVTLAQAQPPFTCPYYDGANDYANIYSAALNTAWNRLETSFAIWGKVYDSAVWSDGVARRLLNLVTNPITEGIILRKGVSANSLYVASLIGGTTKAVSPGSISTTGWFHLAVTVSKTADQVKVYYNGAQNGSTQTGLGASSGNNLLSTNCCIGAENTSPGNVWNGWLAHAALWNRPLSAAEVANLYAWGA